MLPKLKNRQTHCAASFYISPNKSNKFCVQKGKKLTLKGRIRCLNVKTSIRMHTQINFYTREYILASFGRSVGWSIVLSKFLIQNAEFHTLFHTHVECIKKRDRKIAKQRRSFGRLNWTKHTHWHVVLKCALFVDVAHRKYPTRDEFICQNNGTSPYSIAEPICPDAHYFV